MEKIFGIDLGTTNSEIAYLKDGRPVVVEIENGLKYLPSVVGVDPAGNIITGLAARNQHAAYPENTVVSVKRKMGSGETLEMAGTRYSPAMISSHILRTLKKAAERETGEEVRKAVITVPAYFTDLQRKDTVEAGELAGLEVARIINEPTAAALAYGCRADGGEKVLVYDLGGGTFDISLLLIERGVFEVMATSGDTFLGGDDFDILLRERLISALPKGAISPEDLKALARLKNTAEATKIALSTQVVCEAKEEFIATREGKPVHLEYTVSRREFEATIEGKLGKTFSLIDRVLEEAKVKDADIAKILLVGGSTYIPRIFDVLSLERGFQVHREVDPTFAVALGAAIQGGIISGEAMDTVLIDVNSHSLGIRTLDIKPTGEFDDDYYSAIIHRNTPIPTTMTRTFFTSVPGQREVEILAYQGEKAVASGNTFIGSFILGSLPPGLPVNSEIDVSFQYNLNGMVEVAAQDRTSGKREKASFDTNRLHDHGSKSAPRPSADRAAE